MSASAAGDVYLDANGNGAEDPGETYLAGFRVYADLNQNGSADAGEPATLSDNLGKFQLAGLAAGTVRLAQEAQPGYTVTEPAGGFVDVTLADGQVADVDFGNHPDNPSGIIRGSIFNDANGDGVQNLGEPYQAGWTAYVDANLNGQPDAGEPTATTDGTGYFAFQGLSPGTYRVREVVQGGWAQTRPSAGYYDVPLAAGQTVVDRIFGNRQLPPPGAKVVGQVFNDSNADGLKQSAEVGVPGVTVFLDANANGLPDAGEATAVTNAGGSYSFTGLAGGTYQVIQVVPAGYRATTPVAAGVTVAANGTAVLTFGDTQKALLAGTVWDDANGNGVRDAGEPGIAGRSVFLDLNKNFNQDAGEPVATTDAAWAYAFNVAAGAYRVREVIPASGWRTTTLFFSDVTAAAGQVLTRDFGTTRNVMIAGTVYGDANHNGVQDAGEAGLAGWQVFVDLNNDGVRQANEELVTTDAAGRYRITDLLAGTYTVRVVQPQGYTCTSPVGGAYTVTLGVAQGTEKLNFGEAVG